MCHDCSGSHTCCNKKRDGCSGCPSSASCGGCQGGCRRGKRLTPLELELLFRLQQIPFLPLARFLLKSSPLPPPLQRRPRPSLSAGGRRLPGDRQGDGAALLSLEEAGLVTLDYDIPLQGGSDALYAQSPLYQEFVQVAARAAPSRERSLTSPPWRWGAWPSPPRAGAGRPPAKPVRL